MGHGRGVSKNLPQTDLNVPQQIHLRRLNASNIELEDGENWKDSSGERSTINGQECHNASAGIGGTRSSDTDGSDMSLGKQEIRVDGVLY